MTKTSKPIVRIHNTETNEIIDREMNAAEYEKYLADKAITDANAAAFADKEAARQAILDRLGLTADEAKLILG
jgi:phosphopantetheinyl transferase (holo-ACP synthase)